MGNSIPYTLFERKHLRILHAKFPLFGLVANDLELDYLNPRVACDFRCTENVMLRIIISGPKFSLSSLENVTLLTHLSQRKANSIIEL